MATKIKTRNKLTLPATQTTAYTASLPADTATREYIGLDITGNAANITITATSGANILTAGSSTIVDKAKQTLVGGAGNDTLKGNGKSSLVGGAGNDTYVISKTGDTISDTSGTSDIALVSVNGYSLAGGVAVEKLVMSGAAARIAGNELANTIIGTAGANTIYGGGGADTIDAGSGNDLIIVAGTAGLSLLNIVGGAGIDTLQISATTLGELSAVNLDNISGVEYFKVGTKTYNLDRFEGVVENQQTLSTSYANLSTASASYTAALATSNASFTAALATASASYAAALSTATNTNVSNAADNLQNAVNTLALQSVILGGAAASLSIVGGVSGNTYYGVSTSGTLLSVSYASLVPSATLNGNNSSNLATALTGTAAGNWYFMGGPGADTFTGNSSANTFIGGSGADVITSGGGADYIDGGLGADTFNFASGDLTSSVTLSGGSQADTIVFTAAATVADSAFTNVSSVESITGTVGLNISVGSLAQAAGITTVTGGTTSDSFTDALTTGTTPFNFVGGNGADTFSFANTTRFAADYVTGGTGLDQVVITTDGQSLADAAFARIAAGTIESLSLSGGANSVVFGTTANAAGFTSSVTTGAGDDYISVASGFTSTTTFNAGSGNDTFVINSTQAATFIGGLGNDTFSTAQTGSLTFASSLSGGSGSNVLAFTGVGASIVDAGFANASYIQAITSVGTISAVLADAAQAAGVVSVTGSTGADTFSYAGSTAITFTGGSGADSFAVTGASNNASTFSGGDAVDTFTFATSAQLTAASVDGGAGSDTIFISGGASATDSAFSRIAAGTVEALTISGSASSLIVGSNALAAGIRTITGGTAADTIIANYGTTAVTLSGGGGADTLGGSAAAATNSSNVTFAFTDMSNYTGSSLFASSAGTNVLSFANSVVFADGNFTSSSNVATLQLNGTAASAITVGTSAAPAGFTSITAAGATTGSVFTLGGFTSAISFVGSSGDDTFVHGGVGFTAASSINAGAGTDTIRYDGAAVADSIFQKITAGTAEVLSATSSNTITVGSNALNAGIRTVNSGSDSVTFNVDSSFGTTGIFINASAASGTRSGTFNFVNGSALSNSGITGSADIYDVISFTTGVTVTSLSGVVGVETINLNGTSSSNLSFGYGGSTSTLTILGTASANLISAATRNDGRVSLVGGSAYADTFTGGGLADTLQGWDTANSVAIDSLTGGGGADLFVIASGFTGTLDVSGNLGYLSGSYAIIKDYGLGSDKIGIGGTTGGSNVFAAQNTSANGYQFQIVYNGVQTVAWGNFASGQGYTDASQIVFG